MAPCAVRLNSTAVPHLCVVAATATHRGCLCLACGGGLQLHLVRQSVVQHTHTWRPACCGLFSPHPSSANNSEASSCTSGSFWRHAGYLSVLQALRASVVGSSWAVLQCHAAPECRAGSSGLRQPAAWVVGWCGMQPAALRFCLLGRICSMCSCALLMHAGPCICHCM